MTQKQKRIKLAEASGWELKSNGLSRMWSWQNESLNHRKKWVAHKEMASQGVLPNYFSDLNAVHELERIIDKLCKEGDYWFHLRELCDFPDAESDWDKVDFFTAVHATAAQRAEAIGLTLGLWEAAK